MKVILSFLIAIGIGAGCRVCGLSLPAPPTMQGVLMIAAIWFGWVLGGML